MAYEGIWTGSDDGETWRVEVELDRMKEGRPFVVTIYSRHHDGTDDHTTLVCLSPEQAMEVSDLLAKCASQARKLNRERGPFV